FTWSVGNQTQKSLAGVLCTLLHQILSQFIDIYTVMLGGHRTAFESKREHSDWSLNELEALFLAAVKSSTRPICAFIDGLDGIDQSDPAEVTKLMNWLLQTAQLQKTKICASSRPESIFLNRLHKFRHLRVQDLTEKDIQTHGMFLWVHLVIGHIRTDAEYYSSWTSLIQRVDELPSSPSSLYEMVWGHRNGNSSINRAETAYYLNALLIDGRDNLLQVMLECNVDMQQKIL
ncbi:hypothetical protein BU23DRAFT_458953, partial [Bimuria novae-zelandiae CBS 107.79]